MPGHAAFALVPRKNQGQRECLPNMGTSCLSLIPSLISSDFLFRLLEANVA
jgi:hypothetical protein